MDERTTNMLIQVAGFLNMMALGVVVVPDPTRKEAAELLEKVGALLASEIA